MSALKLSKILYIHVGSEVPTALVKKNFILWDITACCLVADVWEDHVAYICRFEV
jgi:hypothetical protein